MTLADNIRPYVSEIVKEAADGKHDAREIIQLYQLHVACPQDPGAPALCEAAFNQWLEKRKPKE
jgi:hypothetical protein